MTIGPGGVRELPQLEMGLQMELSSISSIGEQSELGKMRLWVVVEMTELPESWHITCRSPMDRQS